MPFIIALNYLLLSFDILIRSAWNADIGPRENMAYHSIFKNSPKERHVPILKNSPEEGWNFSGHLLGAFYRWHGRKNQQQKTFWGVVQKALENECKGHCSKLMFFDAQNRNNAIPCHSSSFPCPCFRSKETPRWWKRHIVASREIARAWASKFPTTRKR